MRTFRAEVEEQLRALRDAIVLGLEKLEGGARFQRKPWTRAEGGGGEISELRGELFEKGGVNFSAVSGPRYPGVPGAGAQGEGRTPGQASAEEDAALGIAPPPPDALAGKPFFATGVSLVLHPRNPFVPVVHMNVRYLEVGELAWFGGGLDLTPMVPFDEDTLHFHETLRAVCDRRDPRAYPRLKRWAKEYFFLPHRGTERGVGGIFFDYLRGPERGQDFDFVRAVGGAFLPAYAPLVERRRGAFVEPEDRTRQLAWRGRYVEFNLLYDRGTIFGLRSGGNLDAIFMSLPPLVSW